MTSQDSRNNYKKFDEAWQFLWEQAVKTIHTAIPAEVVSYSPSTKRASVQPLLRMVLTTGEELRYPPIPDVPVLQPSAGGMAILFPVTAGDPVMLLVAERGIAAFKASYSEEAPDPTPFFSTRDAVALLGFGAVNVTPVDTNSLSLQTEDGQTSLTIGPGEVSMSAGGNVLRLTGSGLTLNGAPL